MYTMSYSLYEKILLFFNIRLVLPTNLLYEGKFHWKGRLGKGIKDERVNLTI